MYWFWHLTTLVKCPDGSACGIPLLAPVVYWHLHLFRILGRLYSPPLVLDRFLPTQWGRGRLAALCHLLVCFPFCSSFTFSAVLLLHFMTSWSLRGAGKCHALSGHKWLSSLSFPIVLFWVHCLALVKADVWTATLLQLCENTPSGFAMPCVHTLCLSCASGLVRLYPGGHKQKGEETPGGPCSSWEAVCRSLSWRRKDWRLLTVAGLVLCSACACVVGWNLKAPSIACLGILMSPP